MLTKILKMHQNILKSSRAVIKGLPVSLICTLFFTTTMFVVITVAISIFAQTISEEARKHMVRGETAVKMAKTPADYEEAIKEFKKAAELAPEWPDIYYNLGIVADKAGNYELAVESLKKYLALAPNSPDAEKVRNLLYEVEYKKDAADKKLSKIEGTWEVTATAWNHSWCLCDETIIQFERIYGTLKAKVFTFCEIKRIIKERSQGGGEFRKWSLSKYVDVKISGDTLSFSYNFTSVTVPTSGGYPEFRQQNHRISVYDVSLVSESKMEGKVDCVGTEGSAIFVKRY